MGANWVSFLTGSDFLTNAKEIRIVSYGVVLRCPLSANNASGQVIVGTVAAPTVGESFVSGTMNMAEVQVHALAAGTELTWISRPLGPEAHLFKPYSGFTTTMSDFDWTSLSVDISGSYTGVTDGPLMIAEVCMNVEFTLNTTTTGLGNLAKAAPAPNKMALAAADKIRSTTPSFIQGGIQTASSKIESLATSALDSVMSEGMAFFSSLLL